MKVKPSILAACLLAANLAHAAGVPGQGDWETSLLGRDLDGNLANGFEAYYDSSLNISWLATAQAPAGNLSWAAAKSWAAGLSVGGVSGWRLPGLSVGGDGACHFSTSGSDCGYNVNVANSELAHLFYVTLGNRSTVAPGGGPQSGGGLTNTGPFNGMLEGDYWTGSAYAPAFEDYAWFFNTGAGLQMHSQQTFTLAAWAVHDGDVAAVPEPQTWGLILLGLGLLAARRSFIRSRG